MEKNFHGTFRSLCNKRQILNFPACIFKDMLTFYNFFHDSIISKKSCKYAWSIDKKRILGKKLFTVINVWPEDYWFTKSDYKSAYNFFSLLFGNITGNYKFLIWFYGLGDVYNEVYVRRNQLSKPFWFRIDYEHSNLQAVYLNNVQRIFCIQMENGIGKISVFGSW